MICWRRQVPVLKLAPAPSRIRTSKYAQRSTAPRPACGQKFDKQPLVEASIRQTIGNTYLDLGIYPESQKQIERALELRRRLLGEDHPDTLVSMRSLGLLYRDQGKQAQAESLLTKVIDFQRRLVGENHPDTLETTFDLASAVRRPGKVCEG